jgi:hypothetical protein
MPVTGPYGGALICYILSVSFVSLPLAWYFRRFLEVQLHEPLEEKDEEEVELVSTKASSPLSNDGGFEAIEV